MKLDFMGKFKAAHRVSTPLITVRTFDNKSTIERIKALKDSKGESYAMVQWDCVQGLIAVTNPGKKSLDNAFKLSESQAPLTANMAEALRVSGFIGEDCILIMCNAHLFWTTPEHIQGIWNLRDKFKAWGSTLVLLTGNGAILPAELSNDFLALDEPLPTKGELETIVNDMFEYNKLDKPSPDVLEQATRALIGLPAFPAEQSTAMCLSIKNKELNISELWERKRQAINQTRGLTVLETDASLESIGGLEQFKEYLEAVMNGKDSPNVILVWDEIEKGLAGMGTDTSGTTTMMGGNILTWSNDTGMRGLISVGVPGCGKTEIAKAIANKYGKLCILVSIPNMQSGLVGSSNEHLMNALAMIDAISDKKVLSIATSNNIGSLSAEIQRRFATEGIFFFDAPTPIERESIWRVYRTKYSIPESDPTPNDNGWTGAEIRNCALKAYRLNIPLSKAADYIVPVTVSNASTIDALRRSCSGKYLSASNTGTYSYDGPKAEETVSGRKMR